MWQGIDSEIIAGVSAQAGKYIFTRTRPSDHGQSLPVVPARLELQLSQRGGFRRRRAGHALHARIRQRVSGDLRPALLPLYVGAGRIKNQAHWQTDVLAGWAVGGLSGWYAHSRDVPIMIQLLPHGFEIGFKKQF